jgi:SagB-type dehydrogenase family enzyme
MGIGECLAKRRSVREYSDVPLSLEQAASLLWAAQGITGIGGLRTAPSAGAMFPLRTYAAVGNVCGIPAGLYSFDADSLELAAIAKGDKRKRIMQAAMGQECAQNCVMVVLLAADCRRMEREFGDRALRLATMEAGHAGQNYCLMATALGLGAIGLGRFDDDLVRHVFQLRAVETPLYLLLAGNV